MSYDSIFTNQYIVVFHLSQVFKDYKVNFVIVILYKNFNIIIVYY